MGGKVGEVKEFTFVLWGLVATEYFYLILGCKYRELHSLLLFKYTQILITLLWLKMQC